MVNNTTKSRNNGENAIKTVLSHPCCTSSKTTFTRRNPIDMSWIDCDSQTMSLGRFPSSIASMPLPMPDWNSNPSMASIATTVAITSLRLRRGSSCHRRDREDLSFDSCSESIQQSLRISFLSMHPVPRVKTPAGLVQTSSFSVIFDPACNRPVHGTGEGSISSVRSSVATDIVSVATNVAVSKEGVESTCAFVCCTD